MSDSTDPSLPSRTPEVTAGVAEEALRVVPNAVIGRRPRYGSGRPGLREAPCEFGAKRHRVPIVPSRSESKRGGFPQHFERRSDLPAGSGTGLPPVLRSNTAEGGHSRTWRSSWLA